MELSQNDFINEGECRELAKLMERKYANYLDQRFFETKIRADQFGVYATVTLRNESGSFVYPVEGRLAYEDQGLSKREAGLFLLDYIDLYFEEYLKEDGQVYLPIDWADYECEDVSLQLKGQIFNEVLEREADAWLEGRGEDAVLQ